MPALPPSLSRLYRLRTPAELHAIASPARQEFLTGLQALQPCTMSELGEYLGRLPVSLYYHLRKLEAVGLVVERGERETERGTEALYQLRARELRVDPDDRSGANLQALRKIGAGVLRFANRLHDSAVAEKPGRSKLQRTNLLYQRTLRLDSKGLERVNAKLHELIDLMAQEQAPEGDAFFTLTLHLAPNPVRGPAEEGR